MIPKKMVHFDAYTWIAVGCIVIVILLALAEAVTYYFTQMFPWNPESLLTPKIWLRRFSQKTFYIVVHFLGSIIGCYVIIGLCWCLLGAILNPEVFLPYAAASATFIVFCGQKIKSMVNTW